jgi:2-oxoisovalerate dehydrogenase E2 component (dihydrolipoyl transacylase)
VAEYLLPDVGEGLTEAEIVSWRVKVGDTIAVNDVVCDIETAKSIVELPSPYAGTVLALLVPEGVVVPVGTPIIAIGEEATIAAGPHRSRPAPAETPSTPSDLTNLATPDSTALLVGYGPGEAATSRRRRRSVPVFEPVHAEVALVSAGSSNKPSNKPSDQPSSKPSDKPGDEAVDGIHVDAVPPRVQAAPAVRRLARELGVDLNDLTGTGPGAIITKADVMATQSGAATALSTPSYQPQPGDLREPIKGLRKTMAAAMVSSAFSIPQVTEWITIDVTRTVEFVDRLKGRSEFASVKVSPLLILAFAVTKALKRHPLLNSVWDDAAGEVVLKKSVNLGIAAATPRGLVVPNIRDAGKLRLLELAAALTTLTETAREGRTQPAEMAGGSFTITNVGVFGVDSGTPLINPGEAAILALGAIRKQPWVVSGLGGGDEMVIRQVTTIAVSFDHRHIDGAAASLFLADVAGMMSEPATALLD